MKHTHEVTQVDFHVRYQHDDGAEWHLDHTADEHGHTLVMLVAWKGSITAETQGDRFDHAFPT